MLKDRRVKIAALHHVIALLYNPSENNLQHPAWTTRPPPPPWDLSTAGHIPLLNMWFCKLTSPKLNPDRTEPRVLEVARLSEKCSLLLFLLLAARWQQRFESASDDGSLSGETEEEEGRKLGRGCFPSNCRFVCVSVKTAGLYRSFSSRWTFKILLWHWSPVRLVSFVLPVMSGSLDSGGEMSTAQLIQQVRNTSIQKHDLPVRQPNWSVYQYIK